MRRPLIIVLLTLLCFSCLKDNKINKVERSLVWPLKIGNYWKYSGVVGSVGGGSRDTTELILEIDSVTYFEGHEYFAAKGYYDQWYRSAKGETWQANATGDDIGMIAKNVNDQRLVIYSRAGYLQLLYKWSPFQWYTYPCCQFTSSSHQQLQLYQHRRDIRE